MEGPLRSALGALGGVLSGLPDLRLPIKQVSTPSWLLNTYLGAPRAWDCEGRFRFVQHGVASPRSFAGLQAGRGAPGAVPTSEGRPPPQFEQLGPSSHPPPAALAAPRPPADDSLRITRGDGGSVFILVKDSFADTG